MDQLDALVALEDIRRLKAKYFRTLDAKDWPGFRAVFTSDAVMDMTAEIDEHAHDAAGSLLAGKDPMLRGSDVITDFVSAALPVSVVSVHHGFMPEIELTGTDTASAIWAMTDYLEWGGAGIRGYGHYHEQYRRADGAWLISHLRLSRIRVDHF